MSATRLLFIECSPRGGNATSSGFGRLLLSAIRRRIGAGVTVTERHLGLEPLPPISAAYAESLLLPAEKARARFQGQLAVSDELIGELEAADLLIIASPVHNFTVPAALKTWIDYVVRNGVTFTSTPEGKIGLLRDRPTLIAVTSGGAMFRDPPVQPDFFRPYLSAVLGVIGLRDVTFAQSTGLAFAPEPLVEIERQADAWVKAHLDRLLSAAAGSSSHQGKTSLVPGAAEVG